MTKQEFIQAAKKETNVNVYSIKRVTEKGNKGWLINFSNQLDETTITTEKEKTFWNQDLSEIADKWIYNGKLS